MSALVDLTNTLNSAHPKLNSFIPSLPPRNCKTPEDPQSSTSSSQKLGYHPNLTLLVLRSGQPTWYTQIHLHEFTHSRLPTALYFHCYQLSLHHHIPLSGQLLTHLLAGITLQPLIISTASKQSSMPLSKMEIPSLALVPMENLPVPAWYWTLGVQSCFLLRSLHLSFLNKVPHPPLLFFFQLPASLCSGPHWTQLTPNPPSGVQLKSHQMSAEASFLYASVRWETLQTQCSHCRPSPKGQCDYLYELTPGCTAD